MDAGGGGEQFDSRTVEDVFGDFKRRRTALIKALTVGGFFFLVCVVWFFECLLTVPLKPLSFHWIFVVVCEKLR